MPNDNIRAATPWWFWVLSALVLIYELMGIANYLGMAMATPESYAAQGYTPEQIAFMSDIPILYTSVFALAVWSGLLGAILLLLRKSWAAYVLAFSFLMVLISFVFDITGGTFDVLGQAYLHIMLAVTFVSLLSVIFAFRMKRRGILK